MTPNAPPHTQGVLPNAEATFALGQRLGARLALGQRVFLSGELGAGKTTLCRGIAAGFGVADLTQVTSPTYALMHEYPARNGWLVHIDAYRLATAEHAVELGLEEAWLRRDAVVVLEWAERLGSLVPPPALHVSLTVAEGNEALGRTVTLAGQAALRANLDL